MTSARPIEQSDLDALLELLDGDTLREIITIFASSAPERIAAARDGIDAGDLQAAASAFHAMRSGCGQLGARHLEALCAEGERLAKAGDADGTLANLERVGPELARSLGWYREHGWLSS